MIRLALWEGPMTQPAAEGDSVPRRFAKYSRATHATVRVWRAGPTTSIEIADDGVGGADDSLGSGLRGLADRVEALDGTLRVSSPPGRGTTVTAELPCA